MNIKNQLLKALVLLIGMIGCMACSEQSEDKDNPPQAGSSNLTVTPGKLNFKAEGGTQELRVKTTYEYFGYDFTADWISADFKDDATYNIITVTAKPNTTSSVRKATFKIIGSNSETGVDETVNITIEQEGNGSSGNKTVVGTGSANINVGDMSLAIASGTFATEDATISISTAAKGKIREGDEISEFYEINMPVNTNKEITVSIKSQKTDNDIYFVAHAPTVSLSSQEYGYGDVISKPTYKNGVYTATIPAFENPDILETNSITVGLAHVDCFGNNSGTRAANENKVGNVSWTIMKTTSISSVGQANLNVAKEYINQYIRQALTIIQNLGFKVGFKKLTDQKLSERHIPIELCDIGKDDGQFCQSAFGNEYSVVKIHKKWINDLVNSSDHDELKRTIIHELLHYYQADYDTRWAPTKYKYVDVDELMMYESTAPWIEKKMCNNVFSNSFVNNNITTNSGGFMRGFNNLSDIYPNKTKGERYQAQGYGMPLLVEYIIQNKFEGEKALVELYEGWFNKGGTTFDCYDRWTNGFMFKYNAELDFRYYNNFIEQACLGKVNPFFTASNFHPNEGDDNYFRVEGEIKLTNNCYPYGGIYNELRIFNYTNEDGKYSLKGKQLKIEQKSEGLTTKLYLFKSENNNFTYVKTLGTATASSPIVITDEKILDELHCITGKQLMYMYLVTTSMETKNTIKSEIIATFENVDATLEIEPSYLEFGPEGGTKSVKITTNQSASNMKYHISDKSWISASGTLKEFKITTTANTSMEPREGNIEIYAVNANGEKIIQKEITIKQKAKSSGLWDISGISISWSVPVSVEKVYKSGDKPEEKTTETIKVSDKAEMTNGTFKCTTTPLGSKGMHVEFLWESSYDLRNNNSASGSFDITDYIGWNGTSSYVYGEINNLIMTYSYTSATDLSTIKTEISAGGIGYPDGNWYWVGSSSKETAADYSPNFKISSFKYNYEYTWDSGYNKQKGTLSHDVDWSKKIEVKIWRNSNSNTRKQ